MPRAGSIQQIVERHLCMGCGACAAARPDIIRMVDTLDHGRRPVISAHAESDSTHDLARICPGREIPAKTSPETGQGAYQSIAWGPILEVWEGHATDPLLRYKGSSGGVVSALSLFCLKPKAFSGAVMVRARRDNPLLNESFIATTRSEVIEASASRYAPASPCERLADLRVNPGPYVFVGKPCDVAGAKKLARQDTAIASSLQLTISIFCAGTPSTQGTRELIDSLGIKHEDQVQRVRYRGEGWPGAMVVDYLQKSTGRQMRASTSYADGWGNILQKHKQWRCQLCADHLGDHADLSVGDPWYRPIDQNDPGQSLILVRSERGRQLLHQAMSAGALTLEPRSVDILAASQPNLEKTKGAVFGRCISARLAGTSAPSYPGAALHRVWWKALTPREKFSSIAGTLKRIVRRWLLRPERAQLLDGRQFRS